VFLLASMPIVQARSIPFCDIAGRTPPQSSKARVHRERQYTPAGDCDIFHWNHRTPLVKVEHVTVCPLPPRPRRMIVRSSIGICYARVMINPPLIHRIRRFTHVSSRLRKAKKGNQTCDAPYPAPELFGSVFPFSSALSRPLFRSAPPSPNPCQPPLTRHGHGRPRSRCSSRAPATKRPNAGERIGSCGAGARVSPRRSAANVQTKNALHVTRHAGASRARSREIAARSRCTNESVHGYTKGWLSVDHRRQLRLPHRPRQFLAQLSSQTSAPRTQLGHLREPSLQPVFPRRPDASCTLNLYVFAPLALGTFLRTSLR
jgi:hypothetical protein